MLFLISNYCMIFIYIILLLTIKETLKRYYAFMDRTTAQMNERLNLAGVKIKVCRGRSLQDWSDGLAYSLYLI